MEETLILIMCIRESYEKIRNSNDRLIDVIVFYLKKKYKITTCPSVNAIGGTIDA